MKKLFFIVLSVSLIGGVFGFDNFVSAQTASSTVATTTSSVSTTTSASTSSGNLSCGPLLRTIQAGQSVTLNASGGNGNYTWTATGLSSTYPGSSFNLTFPNPGTSTITLTSGEQTAFCSIRVLPVGSFPGLPSTGEGGGTMVSVFWTLLSLATVMFAIYAGVKFKQKRQ